jgi:hypothetical protein
MPLRTLRNLVVAAAACATMLAGLLPVPSRGADPHGSLRAALESADGSREDDSGAPAEDAAEDEETEEEEQRGFHLFVAGAGDHRAEAAVGPWSLPATRGGERLAIAAARVRGPPARG